MESVGHFHIIAYTLSRFHSDFFIERRLKNKLTTYLLSRSIFMEINIVLPTVVYNIFAKLEFNRKYFFKSYIFLKNYRVHTHIYIRLDYNTFITQSVVFGKQFLLFYLKLFWLIKKKVYS